MLGERSDQRGLWEADRLYLDHVGRESFYGLLASLRGRLFRDAEFAEFWGFPSRFLFLIAGFFGKEFEEHFADVVSNGPGYLPRQDCYQG